MLNQYEKPGRGGKAKIPHIVINNDLGVSPAQIAGEIASATTFRRWFDPTSVNSDSYPFFENGSWKKILLPGPKDETDQQFVSLIESILTTYDWIKLGEIKETLKRLPVFSSVLTIGVGLGLDGACFWKSHQPDLLYGTQLTAEAWQRFDNAFPKFSSLWQKGIGGLKLMDELIAENVQFDLIAGLRSIGGMDTSEGYNLDDFFKRCSELQKKGGVLLVDPFAQGSQQIWRTMWNIPTNEKLNRDFVDPSSIKKRLRNQGYRMLDIRPYFHQSLLKQYFPNTEEQFNETYPTHWVVLAEK